MSILGGGGGGGPYQGQSEPVSGGPQGNKLSQPSIADFIDFEHILNKQLLHIQTDCASNLPVENMESLTVIQNAFSFNKEMVHLGSDVLQGTCQFSFAIRSGRMNLPKVFWSQFHEVALEKNTNRPKYFEVRF